MTLENFLLKFEPFYKEGINLPPFSWLGEFNFPVSDTVETNIEIILESKNDFEIYGDDKKFFAEYHRHHIDIISEMGFLAKKDDIEDETCFIWYYYFNSKINAISIKYDKSEKKFIVFHDTNKNETRYVNNKVFKKPNL